MFEDFVDLFLFVVGALDDLALFAVAFGDVVLGVSAGGKVTAEAHGDGACGDLGEAGEDYDVGGGDCSGETCGESERNGETVREADDDIADGSGGLEVAFQVWSLRGLGYVGGFVHGGSVVRGVGRWVCDVEGRFLCRDRASFGVRKRLYEHRVAAKGWARQAGYESDDWTAWRERSPYWRL